MKDLSSLNIRPAIDGLYTLNLLRSIYALYVIPTYTTVAGTLHQYDRVVYVHTMFSLRTLYRKKYARLLF